MTIVIVVLVWQLVGAFVVGAAMEADWPNDRDKRQGFKYALLSTFLGPPYSLHIVMAWLGTKLMEYRLRTERVVQVLRGEREPK